MKAVLISTYELGHPPFGLASPAATLLAAGHDVACVDLAAGEWTETVLEEADLVAFYLPMHTATRLAAPVIELVRARNPRAHLCCYGLYAPLNEPFLRKLGVGTLLGGEFEPGLAELALRLEESNAVEQEQALISIERVAFQVPARHLLPPLANYAAVRWNGGRRVAGYTEASRGCKHKCRHCPVVPVYEGRFRIVPLEIVMADVRSQVAAGAGHVTFGDPDFLNGPGHAMAVVKRLHQEFPALTYDVTIKIEHLLKHRDLLATLKETGCAWITSAAESVDDRVLQLLEKGHTKRDFADAVKLVRNAGLHLAPTFIPFTPWTTWDGYRALLETLVELELEEAVAPIQLALRLLIPFSSRLLELPEVKALVGDFDENALVYRWKHPDPSLDELASALLKLVATEQRKVAPRSETFYRIRALAHDTPFPRSPVLPSRAAIPYLEEPWYC